MCLCFEILFSTGYCQGSAGTRDPYSANAMCNIFTFFNIIKIFHHKECDCNQDGSDDCMDDGTCICKENIIGVKCNSCKLGLYGFPNCWNGNFVIEY